MLVNSCYIQSATTLGGRALLCVARQTQGSNQSPSGLWMVALPAEPQPLPKNNLVLAKTTVPLEANKVASATSSSLLESSMFVSRQ